MAISPGGRPADDSPVGTPGGRQNWVDKAGGLPKYIRMVAHALMRKGMSPDRAIPTAVNRIKRWAAGLDDVRPQVQAAAKAALAEWEAKKGVALSVAEQHDAAAILDLAAPAEWVAELEATYDPTLDLAAPRAYVRDGIGRFATEGNKGKGKPGAVRVGPETTKPFGEKRDRPRDPAQYDLSSLSKIRRVMRDWAEVPMVARAAVKARMRLRAKALGATPRLLALIGGLGDGDGTREKGEGSGAALRNKNANAWLKRQGFELSVLDAEADLVLELAAAADELDLAPGDYSPPYDWKHGYIPLTAAAALSKAKKGPHAGKGRTKTPKGRKPSTRATAKPKAVAGKRSSPSPSTRAGSSSRAQAKARDDEQRGRGIPGAVASLDAKRAEQAKRAGAEQKAQESAAGSPRKNLPGGGSYPVKDDGSPDYGKMSSEQAATIRARVNGRGVGATVDTDQGRGTVKAVTSRSTTVDLDNGGVINIAAGTPGHDRIKPAAAAKGAPASRAREAFKASRDAERAELMGRADQRARQREAARKDAAADSTREKARQLGYDAGRRPGASKFDSLDSLERYIDAHENKRPFPVGESVNARQPGIDRVTVGRVVGYDDKGMVKVAYKDRKGETQTGTFNPSHVTETGRPEETRRNDQLRKDMDRRPTSPPTGKVDSTLPNRSDETATDRRAQERAIERKDYANAEGPALAKAAADRGLIGRERALQKSDKELRKLLKDADDRAAASAARGPSRGVSPGARTTPPGGRKAGPKAPPVDEAREADNKLRASGHRIGSEAFPGWDGLTSSDGRWEVVGGKGMWGVSARTARNAGYAHRARSKKEAQDWVEARYEGTIDNRKTELEGGPSATPPTRGELIAGKRKTPDTTKPNDMPGLGQSKTPAANEAQEYARGLSDAELKAAQGRQLSARVRAAVDAEAARRRGVSAGAAKPKGSGRFSPKPPAEPNERQQKFLRAKELEKTDPSAAAKLYDELGNRENEAARARGKAIRSEPVTSGITADTARKMTDDQLERAMSRLMANNDYNGPAFAVIEAELDRRDKARAEGNARRR